MSVTGKLLVHFTDDTDEMELQACTTASVCSSSLQSAAQLCMVCHLYAIERSFPLSQDNRCRLLGGSFAIWIQIGLAATAIVTLLYKRLQVR